MPLKTFSATSWALSDVGLRRLNNEDVYAILNENHFYALADGMGGHRAGEVAARLAVDRLCSLFLTSMTDLSSDVAHEHLIERLDNAIQLANAHVYQMAMSNAGWSGMGTTLSCLFLHEEGLIFGHVGDSRIYRFRGQLEQLTNDHSLRNDPHASIRYKNKLTRAIGTTLFVNPDLGIEKLLPGDFYLLCSDGLTDHVPDETIASLFSKNLPLPTLCIDLIEAAKAAGGYDNITVVAVKVE